MKTSLLAALLLAAAPLLYAADTPDTQPSEPTVPERLANARKAIAAGNWSVALRELETAARAAPENADVHNLLGYSWRKRATPDLQKAFQHYNMALKFNPRHKGAHEYIGEAYLMDSKPEMAERHLAELEKICGNRSCEEYQDLARAIGAFKAKN